MNTEHFPWLALLAAPASEYTHYAQVKSNTYSEHVILPQAECCTFAKVAVFC